MPPAEKRRHWRQHIQRMNPDLLYAEDIGAPGSKIDVEVIAVEPGYAKNPSGKKALYILSFRGARKRLGIGATGCKTLRRITGSDDWMEWMGWITLVVIHTKYFDQTTQQDEETDAIRIAPSRPRQAGATTAQVGTPVGSPDAEEQAEIARREAEGKS